MGEALKELAVWVFGFICGVLSVMLFVGYKVGE